MASIWLSCPHALIPGTRRRQGVGKGAGTVVGAVVGVGVGAGVGAVIGVGSGTVVARGAARSSRTIIPKI